MSSDGSPQSGYDPIATVRWAESRLRHAAQAAGKTWLFGRAATLCHQEATGQGPFGAAATDAQRPGRGGGAQRRQRRGDPRLRGGTQGSARLRPGRLEPGRPGHAGGTAARGLRAGVPGGRDQGEPKAEGEPARVPGGQPHLPRGTGQAPRGGPEARGGAGLCGGCRHDRRGGGRVCPGRRRRRRGQAQADRGPARGEGAVSGHAVGRLSNEAQSRLPDDASAATAERPEDLAPHRDGARDRDPVDGSSPGRAAAPISRSRSTPPAWRCWPTSAATWSGPWPPGSGWPRPLRPSASPCHWC